MINIVLCDDHPLIRDGLRELINSQLECEVVGETGTGNEMLPLVHEFKPDILITDMSMPGIPVLDVIRQLKRSKAKTKIIVLSMHNDDDYVTRAATAGADAYVTKDSASDELVTAIEEVMDGRKYLSAGLAQVYTGKILPTKVESEPAITITSREKQVLALAADGLSSAEIARALRISPRTAETHRANLMRKLDLHSQTDLVHFAFRHGLATVSKA